MPDIPTTKHASIDSSSPKAEFNYPRSDKTSAEHLAEGLIKTLSPSSPSSSSPPLIVSSTPDVKPGWYTSEFWLTALVIIGVFASLILGRITVNDIANLWPLFTGPAAYALSRGLAKKG